MLAPLRRSLGERIPAQTRICSRAIHSQKPIRGPAAAQAQISDDYLVQSITQLKPENTSKQSGPLQQKFKSPPAPVQTQALHRKAKSSKAAVQPKPLQKQINSSKSNKSSKADKATFDTSPKSVQEDSIEDIEKTKTERLATATQTSSPYLWTKENILSLYPEPVEHLLPPRISILSKDNKHYRWRDDPLKFLEVLGTITLEYVSLKKTKIAEGYRVRLHMNWGIQNGLAIGDGPTKVHQSLLPTNGRKLLQEMLQCTS